MNDAVIAPEMVGATRYERQGCAVFEVDTANACLKNTPWRYLGRFGRRKYENLLFFSATTKQPKFIYV